MSFRRVVLALITTCSVLCFVPRVTAAMPASQAAKVSKDVREFASVVARGVTRHGPVAWKEYFADRPSFFMVNDGQMAFASGDDFKSAIPKVMASITSIELRWGDLRIDPLTPSLAMFAAPFHERVVDPSGHAVEASGYFTGLAELGPNGWKFRNAHWSTTKPANHE